MLGAGKQWKRGVQLMVLRNLGAGLRVLLVAVAVHVGVGGSEYAVIADAGSTGTRVYLFELSELNGPQSSRVKTTKLGKGPAISSFQDKPGEAAATVKPQLEKALKMISEPNHSALLVSVFATAGMRLLAASVQDAIFKGLEAGLRDAGLISSRGQFEARTISGREEGLFAVIAANYLAKRVQSVPHLMGVLDLGGSSTQVGVPPLLAPGEHLEEKLGPEHTYVRSYLKLGMERVRQLTYSRMVEGAQERIRSLRAVPNPCAFFGYSEPAELWRGTGHAPACEEAVAAAVQQEKSTCALAAKSAGDECLGQSTVPTPHGPATAAKFFLISGYMYVTDFARWWLERPEVRPIAKTILEPSGSLSMPTITELREVAGILCAEPWDTLNVTATNASGRHRFTPNEKVPHRCFELNYIISLLSSGYGFRESERLFHIVEDIDGDEIEWTLGAFLHQRATRAMEGGSLHEL